MEQPAVRVQRPVRALCDQYPDQPGHGVVGSVGGHRFGQWTQHGVSAVVQTQQQGGGHRSRVDRYADRWIQRMPTSSSSPATCAVSPGRARRMRVPPGPELPFMRRSGVMGRAREGFLTTVLPSQSAVTNHRSAARKPGIASACVVEQSAAEPAMPVGRHDAVVPNPTAGTLRCPTTESWQNRE